MGKRGTDHTWHLIRYVGDGAIYAKCKCGYHYNCGRSKRDDGCSWPLTQIPTIFYPYCPSCGARKKRHSTDVERSKTEILDAPMGGAIYDMSGNFTE